MVGSFRWVVGAVTVKMQRLSLAVCQKLKMAAVQCDYYYAHWQQEPRVQLPLIMKFDIVWSNSRL